MGVFIPAVPLGIYHVKSRINNYRASIDGKASFVTMHYTELKILSLWSHNYLTFHNASKSEGNILHR